MPERPRWSLVVLAFLASVLFILCACESEKPNRTDYGSMTNDELRGEVYRVCFDREPEPAAEEPCPKQARAAYRCMLEHNECFVNLLECKRLTDAWGACTRRAVMEGPNPSAAAPETREVVQFIRQNAVRRNATHDFCQGALDCTYFQPEEGKLNLPKDARSCLEEKIPKCQAALDDLERHPAPAPITEAYRKWAYDPELLVLKQAQLALEALEDYGKVPKIKRDGDGYADFWYYWVREHYPKRAASQSELLTQGIELRSDGVNALKDYLNDHDACVPGQNCFPNKVEAGRVVRNAYQ